MKKQTKKIGFIRWYDSMSGSGVVRDMDGNVYSLNFTSINGFDKNNFQYPSESDQNKDIKNLSCEFTVLEGSIVDKLDLKKDKDNSKKFNWMCNWAQENFEID